MKKNNTMRQAPLSNWMMMLTALLTSLILWVIVVNVDDPSKTASFTTTVTVTNENVLTDQGKYYTIADNNGTVTFRVTAKRSIIDRLSNADFSAVADMTYLQDDNTIPIEITAKNYANSISISAQRHYLQIEIGNEMENRFMVTAKTSGTPAEGCAVRSVKVEPNILSVEGPDTVVGKIDRIEATIDVSGMNSDVSETVVPKYLDEDGNTVDITELSISSETVVISADIANIKSVPIVVETSGELPEEYELDSITTDPEEIQIIGEKSVINDLTEIKIPPTVIILDQVTSDLTTTVDISAYLPGDVSLLNTSETQVKITVKLSEDLTKSFDVPVSNLTVENLAQNLNYAFDAEKVTVEITGDRNVVNTLTGETITGTVDASELLAGNHTLEIQFRLADGLKASATTVRVTIKENTETGSGTDAAGASGNAGGTAVNGNTGNTTSETGVESASD